MAFDKWQLPWAHFLLHDFTFHNLSLHPVFTFSLYSTLLLSIQTVMTKISFSSSYICSCRSMSANNSTSYLKESILCMYLQWGDQDRFLYSGPGEHLEIPLEQLRCELHSHHAALRWILVGTSSFCAWVPTHSAYCPRSTLLWHKSDAFRQHIIIGRFLEIPFKEHYFLLSEVLYLFHYWHFYHNYV